MLSHLLTLALCLGLTSLITTSAAHAQLNMGISEGQDQVPQARLRSSLWAQLGVSAGYVRLTSDEVSLKARIDALPTLNLGADLWSDEHLGLMMRASVGLGAELELPMLQSQQTFSFNQHHALMGARYRWYSSESLDALSFELGLGLRYQQDSVPPQRPTYFVDRLSLGPTVMMSSSLPLSDALSVQLLTALSRPVILREDPADSGELSGGYALSAQAQVWYDLSALWSLMLQADYGRDVTSYEGFGTRGLGVNDAESEQASWGVALGARAHIK